MGASAVPCSDFVRLLPDRCPLIGSKGASLGSSTASPARALAFVGHMPGIRKDHRPTLEIEWRRLGTLIPG